MNILITGTSGFLGGATYKFLSHKHNVFPLHAKYNYNFWIIKDRIKKGNFDTIIHFGWGGGANSKDLNSPIQIDNITKSIELFNFGLSVGVKHFYFVSTSWVYGDSFNKKYDEFTGKNRVSEIDPCNPNNLYGFSKLKTEEIWLELAKVNSVKLTIIRPFWIYGPGDRENRFIPTIIDKCLKNVDVELNPCEHKVDYLYIDDFCSGIEVLLDKRVEGIYNFCSGYGMRVKDIVRNIFILTDTKSRLFYNKTYPPGFIQNWTGNDNKLERLGWKHKIDIQKGLKKTIEWRNTK